MSDGTLHTGEILFVKCVKDGIPNRDPLRDSDARRLFGPEDGRISLSDVSIKRDVRDYVLARYPDGGPGHRYGIWVRKEFAEEGGTLLGREGLAKSLLDRYRTAQAREGGAATAKSRRGMGEGDANVETDLLSAAFDMLSVSVWEGTTFSAARVPDRNGCVSARWLPPAVAWKPDRSALR